jgi:DNA polymerase I-like protein with 3'-5' exonuclease and polymerase domains
MATHSHWFPQAVQRIKHQTDLAEKFLRGYICEYVHNGRIHATVNQFRSETGGARSHRFSYADPPLQQMPSRDDEYAPLIRSCFLPEEGDLWCSIDWRQQEYRLIVFVAELLKARGAKAAADMYRNDPTTDFHNYVAQITRLPRRRAKDVNFAKSYGAGVYKFSLMTGLDQIESKTVMDQYDERLPFVKEASDRYSRFAQDFGYIKLIDGARNHFNLWEAAYRDATAEAVYRINHPNSMYKGTGNRAMYATTSPCSREEAEMRTNDSDHPWRRERLKRAFTHKAFNRMIQGSAARQMKKAMVDIARAGYEPLIQLHDELGFSFADERDGVACAKLMEEACPIITIPMLTDTEWGETWGTAKETYVQAAEKKYFF